MKVEIISSRISNTTIVVDAMIIGIIAGAIINNSGYHGDVVSTVLEDHAINIIYVDGTCACVNYNACDGNRWSYTIGGITTIIDDNSDKAQALDRLYKK